VALSTNSRI